MRKKSKWIVSGLTVVAAAALADVLFLEKYLFRVKEFNIGKQNSSRKLKIILLTDLHFKHFMLPQYHKLARKINQLQPDLIFVAGDSIDSSGSSKPLAKFLNKINSNIKIIAVPGNHDHNAASTLPELRNLYKKNNGNLLINETVKYDVKGEKIAVTGLDDFIKGESNLEAAVKNVGKEEHHFLLLHSPLQQEKAIKKINELNQDRPANEKLNISYIFAGHNHGGQVRLPGFVPVLPKKSGDYVEGWYNEEPPYLFVSKGFGTSTLPIRFCARSEMILFNYMV